MSFVINAFRCNAGHQRISFVKSIISQVMVLFLALPSASKNAALQQISGLTRCPPVPMLCTERWSFQLVVSRRDTPSGSSEFRSTVQIGFSPQPIVV
jgi:hypothetical protein